MRTAIAITAALWLGLAPAGAAEKSGGKAKAGVLDGVLRRGSLAAGKAHSKCTGIGLERTQGVTRTAKAVKNGVELLLTSDDPAVAAKLRAEAPAYYARKKDTDCGCCPAAVPGAKTKVKKVPGGVKVVITAPTPEAAEKVRSLAGLKAVPAVEKAPAPVIE